MDALLKDALESPVKVGGMILAGICTYFTLQTWVPGIIVRYRTSHIPKPKGSIPILGHALTLLSGDTWVKFCDWAEQHGSIYKVNVIQQVYVVVSDPAAAKHVMQSSIMKYRKDTNVYRVFDCLLGTGIVTSEGERWHELRRQLAPTFKLEILDSVKTAAVSLTERLFEVLDAAVASGEDVDMSEEFRKITLQVITSTVLGIDPDEADREVSNLYLPIIDECNDRVWYFHRRFLPTPAWWRHWSLVSKLNTYVSTKILNRWNERFKDGKYDNKPRDILDRILASCDEKTFLKGGVQDLRDGLKTFLFAGHDTTSCMLTWALWELMQNPECEAECLKEAKEVFHSGYNIPFDDMKQALPYTFNVLRETLRVYSVVPVVLRELMEDDEVQGVKLPKGVVVCVNMRGIHHKSDVWPGNDTNVFRPSRFGIAATTSPQTGLGEGVDPWAFLPFINGPRNCLGQHFSLLEARIILAMLLMRYKFTPAPGQTNQAHSYKIPISPIDGMRVKVARR